MDDFDRNLARCIGEAASKSGGIDRAMISTCYYEVLSSAAKSELPLVSEKWIDFLADRLSDIKVAGRNPEQATDAIFRKIAKT
jgi:hypothetical protein